MTVAWFALFIPACFAINMAPGPNNLLSMTNAMNFGVKTATLAALSRLIGFAGLIVLTAIGLGALLAASEMAFSIIKWIGAAYLVFLGIKLLRAGTPAMKPDAAQKPDLFALSRQEFWISASNPKAILTFTAFFPQFLTGDAFARDMAVMGLIFLLLEIVSIVLYAMLGTSIRNVARNSGGLKLLNRVSGSVLIGAGVLLALARKPA
jgi:threonine/homoserine/homoserine lactone efflux protein